MSFRSLVVEAVQIVSGDVPGVDMDGGDPADPVVPAGAGSKKGEDLVVLARIRCGGIVPPGIGCVSAARRARSRRPSRPRGRGRRQRRWRAGCRRTCAFLPVVPSRSGAGTGERTSNGGSVVVRRRENVPRGRKGVKRPLAVPFIMGVIRRIVRCSEPAASPDAAPTASGTVLAFWEDRSDRRAGCAQRLPRDSAVLGRRSSSAGRNDPPRTPFLASAPTRPARAGEARGPGMRTGITAGRWAPRRPRRRRAARRRSRPGRARPPSCRGPRTWRRSRRTRPCRPRPGARRRSAP